MIRLRDFREKDLSECHELILCVSISGTERLVLRPNFPGINKRSPNDNSSLNIIINKYVFLSIIVGWIQNHNNWTYELLSLSKNKFHGTRYNLGKITSIPPWLISRSGRTILRMDMTQAVH